MPSTFELQQDGVALTPDTGSDPDYATYTATVCSAVNAIGPGTDTFGEDYVAGNAVITLADGSTTVAVVDFDTIPLVETEVVADVASLPVEPTKADYYVTTNRLMYQSRDGVLVTNGVSVCDTDEEWAAITEAVDNQLLHHRGRGATYIFDTASGSWSWRDGNRSKEKAGAPEYSIEPVFQGLDARAGKEFTRTVYNTFRVADQSRRGDPRPLLSGKALILNGTNEYATGPVVSGLTTQATWSVWVNATALTSPGDYGVIIGAFNETTSESQAVIDLNGADGGNGSVGFYVTRAGTFANFASVTSSPLSSGVWHHIAAVFDNGTLHLYIDGVHQGAQTNVGTGVGATLPATSLATRIGARSGSLIYYFDGKIADPQIFDKALTPTQIKALAANKPVSVKPLIHYTFEDNPLSYQARNSGTLGPAADATITTGSLATIRSGVFPKYSHNNEIGYSSCFTTDGVDDYIDTGVTLNGATAFTIWRRCRYLSTNAFDFDGYFVNAIEGVRLGRDNASTNISFNPGGAARVTAGGAVANNVLHTMAMTADTVNPYLVLVNNAEVTSAATTMSALTNTANSYLIGASQRDSSNFEHFGNIEYHEYFIASRVLTSDERTWLDTKGQVGTPIDFEGDPDILVYYDFATPHPYKVHNIADPSNPGRIVGGTWTAIPASDADPSRDVDQAAGLKPGTLTFKGPCPHDPVATRPAVSLNGDDEYVLIPGASWANMQVIPWDISFWVNSTDTTAGQVFVAFSNFTFSGPTLQIVKGVAPGTLRVFMVSGFDATIFDIESTMVVCDGAWHRVQVTHDGSGNVQATIDGIPAASGTMVLDGTTAIDTLGFGVNLGPSLENYAEITLADVAIAVDGKPVGDWALIEGAGPRVYDHSGQNNNGIIVSGALAAVWAGRCDASNPLITNGFAKGTHFDGASDSYSRATLVGGFSRFCVSFFVVADSLASTKTLLSEWNTTSNRSWYVNLGTSGQLSFGVSDDGTNSSFRNSDNGVVAVGDITHIAITFDSGTVSFEKNGVSVGSGAIADTFAYAGNANFDIAGLYGANLFFGTLSQILVHKDPTVVWGTETKAAIRAAGTTEEIKTIVEGLGGTAWYFPHGDSTETLQNVSGWTVNGSPSALNLAKGVLPVSYGPGVLPPGHTLDFDCDSPDSPFANLIDELAPYEAVFGSGISHVDLGATLIGATDDFDISLDFKRTSLGANASATLFGQYTSAVTGRFHIFVNADNEAAVFIDGTTDVLMYSGAGTVQLNRWYTIRLTRVGDVFTLYLDGVQVATQTQSGISVQQISSRLCEDDGVLDEFNGRMRNLRVVNNGTLTERLTRDIALPGATLTNVTVSKATSHITYTQGEAAAVPTMYARSTFGGDDRLYLFADALIAPDTHIIAADLS